MKRNLIATVVAAALLASAPALVLAAPQAATAATNASSPSKMVLENSTRILTTLEARRDEFKADRGELRDFIASEFNQMFDRDYAGRLVLGVHGRGASDADVKLFSDALADNLMQRYGSSLLDFTRTCRRVLKSSSEEP